MYWMCAFILGVCCVQMPEAKVSLPDISWDDDYRLYEEVGINESVVFPAFREALKGYRHYRKEQDSLLVLIDFTKPSTEKRFYVIDLERKQLLFETYVAHGRNSGENYALSFSNSPGSYKSSLGFFRTETTYYGKNGYSLVLEGLEKGKNDKARERNIVIHGASYADPSFIMSQGRLGRSLGCPALPPSVTRQIIDTIKNGTLLYIHGQTFPGSETT